MTIRAKYVHETVTTFKGGDTLTTRHTDIGYFGIVAEKLANAPSKDNIAEFVHAFRNASELSSSDPFYKHKDVYARVSISKRLGERKTNDQLNHGFYKKLTEPIKRIGFTSGVLEGVIVPLLLEHAETSGDYFESYDLATDALVSAGKYEEAREMFAKLTSLEQVIEVDGLDPFKEKINHLNPKSQEGGRNFDRLTRSINQDLHYIRRMKEGWERDWERSWERDAHCLLTGALIKLGVAAEQGYQIDHLMAEVKPWYSEVLEFLTKSEEVDSNFATSVAVVLDTLVSQGYVPTSTNLPNITINVDNIGTLIQDSIVYKSQLISDDED